VTLNIYSCTHLDQTPNWT